MIEWGEIPMPSPKEGEVLVKVLAVAANPVDTYIRSGKYPLPDGAQFPFVIGKDMVGVVTELGRGATHFKKGQKVWSNSLGKHGVQGSFAEYVSVGEKWLFPAPDNVDDLDIAAVAQAGATAAYGLVRVAALKAGETIVVNGGGGNVGSAVIQLAAARGARVIATTSGEEKIKWCKSSGAESVIDYRNGNVQQAICAIAPQGVDVFWDTSRTPDFDLSVSVMAEKGRIILMAGADARPAFPVGPFYRKSCSLKGFSLVYASADELQQCADIVNLALQTKQLKSKIAKVLPLSGAAQAHAILEAKPEVWGKVLLTC